jgi:hypothetical protein
MLGDMWGLRPALDKYGITLMATENAEVLGNLTGGVKQGFEVNGLTTATLQLDAKQPFGLDGGLFNVSGLHILGGDVSATNLDTLQFATGIEANNTVTDFGNCGIGSSWATSSISRLASRASILNSRSANTGPISSMRRWVGRCFPPRICPAAAPAIPSRA